VCAEKILAARTGELLKAIEAHVIAGGVVIMVTLTMRHAAGELLSDLWSGLAQAWRAAAGGNRSTRRLFSGVRGWVRRVELTHGRNGWHLHIHALLFMHGPVGAEAALSVGRGMFDAWAGRLVTAGLRAPVRDSGGLDVKVMDLGSARADLARYLSKGTYESAALELAGGSTKRARRGNRSPFDILADLAQQHEARDLALWREYEQASRGKRALTWSRGLRDELLPDDAELTDEQVVEDARDEGAIVLELGHDEIAVYPARQLANLLSVVENSTAEDAFERAARWAIRCHLPPPRLVGAPDDG
jgi:hypothetical protein